MRRAAESAKIISLAKNKTIRKKTSGSNQNIFEKKHSYRRSIGPESGPK